MVKDDINEKTCFYLAFYSDTGCESVEIKATFGKRFDLKQLMNSPAKMTKVQEL